MGGGGGFGARGDSGSRSWWPPLTRAPVRDQPEERDQGSELQKVSKKAPKKGSKKGSRKKPLTRAPVREQPEERGGLLQVVHKSPFDRNSSLTKKYYNMIQ